MSVQFIRGAAHFCFGSGLTGQRESYYGRALRLKIPPNQRKGLVIRHEHEVAIAQIYASRSATAWFKPAICAL